MSGLLFLMDVGAALGVALWLAGAERGARGWRLRLFDMRAQAGEKGGAGVGGGGEGEDGAAPSPRWRAAPRGPEERTARFSAAPGRARRPGWRRNL